MYVEAFERASTWVWTLTAPYSVTRAVSCSAVSA